MITVLVADDQDLIRAGLAALLRAAPGFEVVGEAADGEQTVRLAATHHPDVVLMDIRMPGLNGIDATRQILAGAHQPGIIVLTTFDLDEYVYAALRAGAAGFLLKDMPPERLLAAIQTIAAGEMVFAPAVLCRLVEAYGSHASPATDTPTDLDALTPRETEVLRLVAHGRSNTDIADRLSVSEGTVKTHINRIMTKLGLTSRAQAVTIAYETRLVSPGQYHRRRAGFR